MRHKSLFLMKSDSHPEVLEGPPALSRRTFVHRCALTGFALAMEPVVGWRDVSCPAGSHRLGATSRIMPSDQNWLFGGKFDPAAIEPHFNDAAFARVNVPHCVAKLSWEDWDPAAWEDVWIYRRHFFLPETFQGLRVFLHFDGVMVGATPTINGGELPKQLGGYLPFRYEITDLLVEGDNVLAVEVDSRWSNVPPEGSPMGPKRIDYLEPGGIHRSVRLQAVPKIFIKDVFAKPVQVLERSRRIEVVCSLDAASGIDNPVQVEVELRDETGLVSRIRESVHIQKTGESDVKLTLANLGNIKLWDVEAPHLYDVVTTLLVEGKPVHDHCVRIGLREARFELDGFFLNGRRLQLFGLNRHELYPYVGGAMPRRVMRRDAEILRREFNCNVVRCSHYPQSEAFLDACDELGLMVWEEIPGWGYLGDDAWKDFLVRDVKAMVIRDRNHPSIIIWGVRANESANDVPLYRRTTELAKSLDDSRPVSGSMTSGSKKTWQTDWHEDVFAFDDYHAAPDGSVGINDPVPGVPYMLSEAVGQFNYPGRKGFNNVYRRAGDVDVQLQQAIWHAQAHSRAASNPRICGVIAWCAFDYGSLINSYKRVKCPGVADVFRIPKLGASFYLTQTDPKIRPVIEPNFYWDFGPQTPKGPGNKVAIFSNCDRLALFISGKQHSTLLPDLVNYPHLKHPPFFANLEVDGSSHPELRIDGYLGDKLAVSRSFSSDASQDRLLLKADDNELKAGSSDATRLVFQVVDKFGTNRAFPSGTVSFEIKGPALIVGDNPFSLADSGGVGAIWVKANSGRSGKAVITAKHSTLGQSSVEIMVEPVEKHREVQ